MCDVKGKEQESFFIEKMDYKNEMFFKAVNSTSKAIVKINNCEEERILIKNLLSDNLFKDKSVVIICDGDKNKEKILEYTKDFSDRLLDLPKYNYHEGEVTSLISTKIKALLQNTGKTTLSKINVLSREIEKKQDLLSSVNLFLTKERYSGLNLLDMYRITKKRLRKYDERYKYYRVYRVKKPFLGYKYSLLKSAIEDIFVKDIISKYIKYKRFVNNKLFTNIKKDITDSEIQLINKKINILLNNPLAFELPINNSQYTDDFLEFYCENLSMSPEELNQLVKTVNDKYNSELLYYNVERSFFNILKWKKTKKQQENNIIEYKKIEQIIYEEFEDNLSNLSMYVKAFEFLLGAINKEEFNSFLRQLLKGEDVEEYLELIKSTLNIYESFNLITSEIQQLDGIYLEILDYCYGNVEKKENAAVLLRNIPDLYLYLAIEELETKEKEIINYLEKNNEIIDEITKVKDIKRGLIKDGINYTWLNKVRDLLATRKISDKENNIISQGKLEDNYKELLVKFFPIIILDKDYEEVEKFNIAQNYSKVIIFGDELNERNIESKFNGIDILKILNKDNNNKESEYLTITKESYGSEKEKKLTGERYFQVELMESIKKLGYGVKADVTIDDININIAIESKDTKEVLLLVECDNLVYTKDYNPEIDDVEKYYHLKSHGYTIVRMWSRDWWFSKRSEIDKLANILLTKTIENDHNKS